MMEPRLRLKVTDIRQVIGRAGTVISSWREGSHMRKCFDGTQMVRGDGA